MDPFLGEIRLFAGNFAPAKWALCNGAILPIQRYTALFSLLGTYYGGNGTTTFALPNLQGRTPIHQGQGPGLTQRTLGDEGGQAAVQLSLTEMAAHTHAAQGAPASLQPAPGNAFWSGQAGRGAVSYYGSGTPNAPMAPTLIAPAGGGAAHNNYSPYLALNYIIALEGIFPQRP
jgi:microcystin-dependent protein